MIAIYVRQSVDKKDSISIDSQIDFCRRKLSPDEEDLAEVFSDRGISGKSVMNRPEFLRMLSLVREGKIYKIIVYKVDRISRSMLDFLQMKEEFDRYNVSLVSCKEDFDTSSATGKMMLNLLVMFAQMEREIIQKRITDNYYARGEKGFYLGGYPPFGYRKVEIKRAGKKTYTYAVEESEAKLVHRAYIAFGYEGKSLNEIASWLNGIGVKTRKNCSWSGTTVSRMLLNPVYVRSNAEVYNYIKKAKGIMNNKVDEYIGERGLMVYGNAKNRQQSKYRTYENEFVTLGMHKGIIDAELWLSVQKLLNHQYRHTNIGRGLTTWLQGLVKCECCGYALYVKRIERTTVGQQKVFRYLYCRGKKLGVCTADRKLVTVDFLEKEVEKIVLFQLQQLINLTVTQETHNNKRTNDINIKIALINEQIENLVHAMAEGTAHAIHHINKEIDKLVFEREDLFDSLRKLQMDDDGNGVQFSTKVVLEGWEEYSIKLKKQIAQKLINEIRVNGTDISIIIK